MTFKLATIAALCTAAFALDTGAATAAGAIVSTPVKGTYIYMTHRPSPGFAAGLAMSDCEGKYGGGCRVLATYGYGCMPSPTATTALSTRAGPSSLRQCRPRVGPWANARNTAHLARLMLRTASDTAPSASSPPFRL